MAFISIFDVGVSSNFDVSFDTASQRCCVYITEERAQGLCRAAIAFDKL